MSKLKDMCRKAKVYNDANFFQDEPYIWYQSNGDYRSMIHSAWAITKRGVELSNHWKDYGSLKISCDRESKKERFGDAVRYLETNFGVTELSKGPFGGWGDSGYVKRRLAEIKAVCA